MTTIAVCDRTPRQALLRLERNYRVLDLSGSERAEVLRLLDDAECVVVRSRTRVDSEFMDHAPRLKIVGRIGTGLDNIDVSQAAKRGIKVLSTPKATARSVAEFTIALALDALRGISVGDRAMRQGRWLKNELLGRELYGKMFGIVGFGTVGSEVARIAYALGAQVVCWSRSKPSPEPSYAKYMELDMLLRQSDIVSIHLRLNEETRNMINSDRLRLLKKGCILVNTSRGEVLDEDALYSLLKERTVSSAALDVFKSEPYQGKLLELENVILTPHIAGNTLEGQERAASELVEQIERELPVQKS
ncbi:MAG: hydroxyacid dehydrogenase [Thermoprotei archaeon]